nr:MAG TPA: hypothetical protein [Caudoviricetes sp.]
MKIIEQEINRYHDEIPFYNVQHKSFLHINKIITDI